MLAIDGALLADASFKIVAQSLEVGEPIRIDQFLHAHEAPLQIGPHLCGVVVGKVKVPGIADQIDRADPLREVTRRPIQQIGVFAEYAHEWFDALGRACLSHGSQSRTPPKAVNLSALTTV